MLLQLCGGGGPENLNNQFSISFERSADEEEGEDENDTHEENQDEAGQ